MVVRAFWEFEMERLLLTTQEAAQLFRLKPCTLDRWRHIGNGPKFVKVGGRAVRYLRKDLEDFLVHRTNTAMIK